MVVAVGDDGAHAGTRASVAALPLRRDFIDGGVTGVSMLLASLVHAPLWLLLPLVNLPFIVLGHRRMGRAFAIRSTLAIARAIDESAFVVFHPLSGVEGGVLRRVAMH